MKEMLDLSLVVALVVLPFRASRPGRSNLAVVVVLAAVAFYFYIVYLSPRLL